MNLPGDKQDLRDGAVDETREAPSIQLTYARVRHQLLKDVEAKDQTADRLGPGTGTVWRHPHPVAGD